MEDPCKDCKVNKTIYVDENGHNGFVECQTCPTQKKVVEYCNTLISEAYSIIDSWKKENEK